MIGISKFIERVSAHEQRGARDVVFSMEDARLVRDEIAKLLLELRNAQANNQTETQIEFVGGRW